jgi:hypothetical protein
VASSLARLEQRVRRDFPERGSAEGVLQLLSGLPGKAGYDHAVLAGERVQAAIVMLANGDLGRLRQALDLAAADWRDVLVAAGLADDDWPARLVRELGPVNLKASSREFDVLEFVPAYDCEVDPELPGDGRWGCPVHSFRRDGGIASEPFRSRWGAPMIARFTFADQGMWVGMFEAGGAGGIDGAYACPDSWAALVVCVGRAYLVDVRHPEHTTTIPLEPVTQVCGAGRDLVVLADFSNIAAVGRDSHAWTSERLCLDFLKVISANSSSIECTGDFLEGTEAFTVAASTGELLQGRRFRDAWPGRS